MTRTNFSATALRPEAETRLPLGPLDGEPTRMELQRYMHLSPAATEDAIRWLDSRNGSKPENNR
jgi:hypothetical protein